MYENNVKHYITSIKQMLLDVFSNLAYVAA